eukprot:227497_1
MSSDQDQNKASASASATGSASARESASTTDNATAASAAGASVATATSASASASASTSVSDACFDDATIAQVLHAMEQLTSVFQFTTEEAQDAINAVGPDVTAAYNYILDQGGEDKGGAIIPIKNCPHLSEHAILNVSSIKYENVCGHFREEQNQNQNQNQNKGKGRMKSEYIVGGNCPNGENWLCLHCGVVRCSRYVNEHCKDHAEESGHCIAVSLEDLSVWCYQCSAYLTHPSLDDTLKTLESLKFQG